MKCLSESKKFCAKWPIQIKFYLSKLLTNRLFLDRIYLHIRIKNQQNENALKHF